MSQPDIFLSYNREDADVARRFADAFAAEGLSVWWDTALRSGEAYDEVTEAALRGAKAVVVLWSPRSVVSRWVRAEATIADRCKTLVPVTIEPCERPIMFELTQTADLAHWTGDAGDLAWLAFLGDVLVLVGRTRSGPAPAAPVAAVGNQPKAQPGKRGAAPTLAVMPFANRSGLPEDDVFAFGMVEDIIEALSQNAAVMVLSSSATIHYRTNAAPDLAAMARELEVRYVLEGNVRRDGDSLRLTAQMIEPSTGRIVWTQRFDRPLSELASMQEDLVLEIAAKLDANVSRLEVERALRKPSDLTAWEAVTRALAAYANWDMTTLERGFEAAAMAVEIDSGYGLGHAVLAYARAIRYNFLTENDQAEIDLVHRHVDQALKLDPANGLALGYISQALSFVGEPQLGLRYAEQAVRQSPTAFQALYAFGQALTLLNRTDEAIAALDKANRGIEQGAFFIVFQGWKGVALMRAGRWDQAEAVEDEMLALDPALNFVLAHKAILCQRAGRTGEAREFVLAVRKTDPNISLAIWELRMARWHVGSPTQDIILESLRAAWIATGATS